MPSHVVTADIKRYPKMGARRKSMLGRSMQVKKADMVKVECVARGYLAGSAYVSTAYRERSAASRCLRDLRDGDQLPEPIFTPATKAITGHDVNVPFRYIANVLGVELAGQLRDLTLEVYYRAANYALQRGIIVADTKLEFGFVDSQLVLADEVLTPDSSRFWPADQYNPGGKADFLRQTVRSGLLGNIAMEQESACAVSSRRGHREDQRKVY